MLKGSICDDNHLIYYWNRLPHSLAVNNAASLNNPELPNDHIRQNYLEEKWARARKPKTYGSSEKKGPPVELDVSNAFLVFPMVNLPAGFLCSSLEAPVDSVRDATGLTENELRFLHVPTNLHKNRLPL
ncbi:hypothetical protein M513_02890 [Trichuris suis]|uniref:Uncharacterized protein n=1 Tax=Trichuris suis TaxID=68888 RepID=A0A085MFW6_9BILA|nr:hypothetical protein M513_02890 [Trichuris suis]